MKNNKKKIWIAVLCAIVLVLCIYYFATRDNNKTDDKETNTQAEITNLK